MLRKVHITIASLTKKSSYLKPIKLFSDSIYVFYGWRLRDAVYARYWLDLLESCFRLLSLLYSIKSMLQCWHKRYWLDEACLEIFVSSVDSQRPHHKSCVFA